MDCQKLYYFEVLAGEQHFRKASEKLFISQPALSKQIRELERELGVLLFDRDNRNVKLTEAGIYLHAEAKILRERMQEITRKVQALGRGEEGELRIGFVGSAMQILIPQALAELQKSYAGVTTQLSELSNRDQMKAIQEDRLDAGFIRSEHFPSGIEKMLVLEEQFVLTVPDYHTMTEDLFENLQQLKEERFILFGHSYGEDYYELMMSIFHDQEMEPEVSHRSVHASTIFHLVEKGLGIAIVPASLASGFDLKIRFIPLNKIRQRTRLYLIWKKGNNGILLKNFLEIVLGMAKGQN